MCFIGINPYQTLAWSIRHHGPTRGSIIMDYVTVNFTIRVNPRAGTSPRLLYGKPQFFSSAIISGKLHAQDRFFRVPACE